jgi:hypothetical protein
MPPVCVACDSLRPCDLPLARLNVCCKGQTSKNGNMMNRSLTSSHGTPPLSQAALHRFCRVLVRPSLRFTAFKLFAALFLPCLAGCHYTMPVQQLPFDVSLLLNFHDVTSSNRKYWKITRQHIAIRLTDAELL